MHVKFLELSSIIWTGFAGVNNDNVTDNILQCKGERIVKPLNYTLDVIIIIHMHASRALKHMLYRGVNIALGSFMYSLP